MVVAAAVVLAAMYILRMISGVLHQEVGPAVPEAALDLRPGELAIVVPLVGLLLALSAWPASISQRSFPQDRPAQAVRSQFGTAAPRLVTVFTLGGTSLRSVTVLKNPKRLVIEQADGQTITTSWP